MTKKKIRGLLFFSMAGDFLEGLSRNVLLSIAKEPANSYTAIGRLSD